MEAPLQITFRHMALSPALDEHIRRRAAELDQFYDRITACRVVVESGAHHRHKGRIHQLRIHLTVPGGEIVVSRDPSERHAHEDVYVAIRDGFDAARRQLEDHVRRMRGDTKARQG